MKTDFTWQFKVGSTPLPAAAVASTDQPRPTTLTRNRATIAWNTSDPSDSQIEYGPAALPDDQPYPSQSKLDTRLVTAHSQQLAGLQSQTTYFYRVRSRGTNGELLTSPTFSFKTP